MSFFFVLVECLHVKEGKTEIETALCVVEIPGL